MSAQSACWQQIGIWGDRSCPELAAVAHCHACPTYKAAGAQLLARSAPPAYAAEQTAQLAAPAQSSARGDILLALIFRLGREWLAVPSRVCQQVLPPVSPHTLPHRSNQTLLGMVNVRGQLLLKVSLLETLGLTVVDATSAAAIAKQRQGYPRMLVVESSVESDAGTRHLDVWAFDVDELSGIYPVALGQLETAANGVTTRAETCTRYVFSWQDQQVNLLDDSQLFKSLRQRAL